MKHLSDTELNRLVGEKVMGIRTQEQNQFAMHDDPLHYAPYVTEFSAAHQVRKKIDTMPLEVRQRFREAMPSFHARVVTTAESNVDIWDSIPPKEICLAALSALGVS